MSLIVAARFETFEQAAGASQALQANGFLTDQVSSFLVNAPARCSPDALCGETFAEPGSGRSRQTVLSGVVLGLGLGVVPGGVLVWQLGVPSILLIALALVGAYVGSLAGATSSASNATAGRPETRLPGVLVAVQVSVSNEGLAAGVLRGAGGADLEKAQGEWRDGRWADFDPLKPPAARL